MIWIKKLKALLHDPPYKGLAWDNVKYQISINPNCNNHKTFHEKWACDLIKRLFPNENINDNDVKEADRIASSMSRLILKPELGDENKNKEFEQQINKAASQNKVFIDIFSKKKEDIKTPDYKKVHKLFDELGKLQFNNDEEKAKFIFLFLWRFYPEIFPEIEKHPADLRAPNHSIYDHLVQTSAIVSALPKPAILIFTIGPVQSFISKARKTSDLWAGSYMLSYLTWKSMEPLVKEFGPDVIIYPNLLRQPLCDLWLYRKFKNSPINTANIEEFKEFMKRWNFNNGDEEQLKKLTIANIPNRFVAIIPYDNCKAKMCEIEFKEEIMSLAEKVFEEIKDYSLNDGLKDAIIDQLCDYFQVYWAILPWVGDGNNNYEPDDVLKDYEKLIGKTPLYNTVKEIIDHPYYSNLGSNVGSAYSLIIELVEKLLGARKSVRNFKYLIQPREKCDLCGEYEVLNLDWLKLKKCKPHIIKGRIKKKNDKDEYEGEKLCGICITKRLFPEIINKILEFQGEIKFPSTSEMASIGEKRRLSKVIKRCFKIEFESFRLKYKTIPTSISVLKLKGDTLYDIDGQWLMVSSYRKDYLEREYNFQNVDEGDLEKMRRFLQENNINPSGYYAILQMDGDNMGKWLRGEFNPKIENVIHDGVKDALIKFSEGDELVKILKILCSPHPTSPSIHQAFSRRLSTFALECVRKIVEEKYYGKLVYAGGDDVLALLPIEDVLNCAKDLQKAFKDVLSPKATMSAGIVIVHHKYPLYLALDEVRDAEKRAKNHYGKNAFCLRFLRHSGEARECGGNWELIGFINELIHKFRAEEISSNFPGKYLEIVESLYGKDSEDLRKILKSELKRVFFRKVKSEEKVKKFFGEMLYWFDKLDPLNFANLLIISNALAKEVRI
ncbi:MAG: type III-B CRISPR-associated protein Cas10/Cmr2 [candidate division WOR-3 bacterium]